jgi:FKBP-type peptidyl-prolyl cis-trans isomerase (trigger factor)
MTDQAQAVEQEINQEDLVPANTNQPLVKGFQNKTVVMPLAVLQREVDNLRKLVSGGFREVQEITNNQLQYVYRSVARTSSDVRDLSLQVKALAQLLNVSDEQLASTVKAIEAKEAAEAEAKSDAALGLQVVSRPAEKGDTVKIDFIGKIDGVAFDGGAAKGHRLELGSNSFIPGFEDQLVGVSAGQTVTLKVTFPADYGNQELAGKEAEFETTVHAVKEKKNKA